MLPVGAAHTDTTLPACTLCAVSTHAMLPAVTGCLDEQAGGRRDNDCGGGVHGGWRSQSAQGTLQKAGSLDAIKQGRRGAQVTHRVGQQVGIKLLRPCDVPPGAKRIRATTAGCRPM
eukprot:1805017-Prymnesium_polylepis.1